MRAELRLLIENEKYKHQIGYLLGERQEAHRFMDQEVTFLNKNEDREFWFEVVPEDQKNLTGEDFLVHMVHICAGGWNDRNETHG